jgi:CubicO group peptidase (beta-lactamase class C family)
MRIPDAARAALEQAVARAEVPGGVAAIVDADGATDATAAGVTRIGGDDVAPDTRYDLASLTKVVATLPCVLRLASDGELSLDDRIGRFFVNAGWFQTPEPRRRDVRRCSRTPPACATGSRSSRA